MSEDAVQPVEVTPPIEEEPKVDPISGEVIGYTTRTKIENALKEVNTLVNNRRLSKVSGALIQNALQQFGGMLQQQGQEFIGINVE